MLQNRKILISAIGIVIIVLIIAVFLLNRTSSNNSANDTITDFAQCARAGYPVNESFPRQCKTPDGKVFIEENISGSPSAGQIGIKGEIACLPKKGSSQQTMECAIGLLGDDGKYYALENLADFDTDFKYSQNGKKVDIYGNLTLKEITGPDGNPYDIAGSIRIDGISDADLQ